MQIFGIFFINNIYSMAFHTNKQTYNEMKYLFYDTKEKSIHIYITWNNHKQAMKLIMIITQ